MIGGEAGVGVERGGEDGEGFEAEEEEGVGLDGAGYGCCHGGMVGREEVDGLVVWVVLGV